MKFTRRMLPLVLAAGILGISAPTFAAEPEDTMIITLKDGGEVKIALRPDIAPKHVAQIKALVRQGAYDNVAFHRVIAGFMAQTGDVKFGDLEDGYNAQRTGTGGSDLGNITAEFSTEPYVRGTVGMARSQSKDSANSQFFIMFAPNASLENNYTVIGKVESGMEFVDAIKRGNAAQNGVVSSPDRMVKVRIAADDAVEAETKKSN